MTWNFDPTLATPADQVHWLVGDTEASEPLVQNETITFLLAQQPNVYRVAAQVAKQLARYFARQCDLAVLQEVSISLGQRARAYAEMAKDLEDDANVGMGGSGVGVYAGGISVGDMQAQEADTDWPVPAFTRESQGTRAVPTHTGSGPEGEAC